VTLDAVGHERLDVHREVVDDARSSLTGELPEGKRDWHPPPDALGAVALAREPRDIRLDPRPDP
jgi:hypothetical protein